MPVSRQLAAAGWIAVFDGPVSRIWARSPASGESSPQANSPTLSIVASRVESGIDFESFVVFKAREWVADGLDAAGLLLVPTRINTALAANSARNQDDFQTFYRTARCLFVEACEPYADIEGVNPNLAPPHAHLLLLPVVLLPQRQAYVLWVALSVLIVTAAAVRTVRLFRVEIDWVVLSFVLIAVAGSALTMGLIASGQIYAALTGIVVSGWLWFRAGRTTPAAIFIGIGAAIKPMLLLPAVWFLFNNQWRAALVTVATMVGVSAICSARFGRANSAWLYTVTHLPLEGHFRDGSILALLTRMFRVTGYYEPLVINLHVIFTPWAVLGGFIALITLAKRMTVDRCWLALMSAACLIAPKGWIYAGWWVVFPAFAVWFGYWADPASPWSRGNAALVARHRATLGSAKSSTDADMGFSVPPAWSFLIWVAASALRPRPRRVSVAFASTHLVRGERRNRSSGASAV